MNDFYRPIYLKNQIFYNYKNINIEDIKSGKKGEIQEATDSFFIKDCKKDNIIHYVLMNFFYLLATLMVCFIFFEIINLDENAFPIKTFILLVSLFFSLITLIQSFYHFWRPDKQLILDRLNGLITIPRPLFLKPKVINLSLLQGYLYRSGIPDDYGLGSTCTKLCLKVKNTNIKYNLIEVYIERNASYNELKKEQDPENYWNFIIWYMDKNRPLPEGTAFDKYRRRDLNRIKDEGYPPPLHKDYRTV